jgi:alkylation response protein AidB-like acyl-CoA dehydrogenase
VTPILDRQWQDEDAPMAIWDTPEIRAFRTEIREFCDSECPSDVRHRVRLGLPVPKADIVHWQKRLHARGWFVAHWPEEFGGLGWSALQRFIFEEEAAKAYTPPMLPVGPYYIGPVLYTFGSKAQQDRYLPALRTSDSWWCQGFSEPGAGSDLFSLRTRAERQGERYVVNGQKIWTSTAHWADMIFCLVRTSQEAKKQAGVSFLLIDMKSPGVTVRPIIMMNGRHHVNEVFFENVSVPAENLVGEEGKAWTYANFLLGNERIIVAALGKYKRMLRELRWMTREIFEAGRPLAEDPAIERKLAELEIALRVTEALCVKVLGAVHAGPEIGPIGSILKLKGSELEQSLGAFQVELLQRRGLPFDAAAQREGYTQGVGSEGADGMIGDYLYRRAASLYGGSNEVMHNILAKSALGL